MLPLLALDDPRLPDFRTLTKVAGEAVIGCFGLRHHIPCAVARLTTIMLPQQIVAYNSAEAICAALRTEGQTPGVAMAEQLRHLRDPWLQVEEQVAVIRRERGEVNFVPLDPHGDPWMWHLTDVRDAARGVIAVMEHPDAVGEAFNIAGPTVTWHESAVIQKQRSNIDYALISVPCSWRYALDTSKARKILGWTHACSYEKMYDDARSYLAGQDIGIPY